MSLQVFLSFLAERIIDAHIVSPFFQGYPSVHLTHVTFSPDGDEVLLSYSGEHVYLMNVNHGIVF